MFSRKHYNRIATQAHTHPWRNNVYKEEAIDFLCQVFEADNNYFNPEHFRGLCGLPQHEEESE